MRTILKFLLMACLAAVSTLPAQADPQRERAVAVVDTLLNRAHTALHGGGNGVALRGAISEAFAFDVWERFLIQHREAQFAPAERAAFRESLPGFLAHLYHDQFARGLDTPPSLGEARKVRRDVLVASAFPRANGKTLPVEWRLREFPQRGTQVIDIMVGGTSFLLLKRDEFTAIVDQGGVTALLAHMRDNAL